MYHIHEHLRLVLPVSFYLPATRDRLIFRRNLINCNRVVIVSLSFLRHQRTFGCICSSAGGDRLLTVYAQVMALPICSSPAIVASHFLVVKPRRQAPVTGLFGRPHSVIRSIAGRSIPQSRNCQNVAADTRSIFYPVARHELLFGDAPMQRAIQRAQGVGVVVAHRCFRRKHDL